MDGLDPRFVVALALIFAAYLGVKALIGAVKTAGHKMVTVAHKIVHPHR